MASKRLDPNASLADYKQHVARKQPMGNTKPKEHSARKTPMGNTKSGEHLAQKRTKIDKAIANAQAFQKQRTALINMSTKDKLGAALEAGIIGAATGGGIVAAQKGIRAAVNSGIPARIGNKVTGQTVLVHGSPVKGLTTIKPNFSRATPDERRVYGMRTDVPLDAQSHTQMVTEGYAKGGSWVDKGKELPKGGGSLYVIKTPKKTTDLPAYPKKLKGPEFTESGRPILKFPPSPATSSSSAGRVVGEVPLAGKNTEAIQRALQQELKKAGAKVKPNVVEKALNKVEQQKLLKQKRIANKNSPV